MTSRLVMCLVTMSLQNAEAVNVAVDSKGIFLDKGYNRRVRTKHLVNRTTGDTINLVIGGNKDCEKKDDTYYRASYNQRIRCKMQGALEVCEECSGKTDCWYGDKGTCDGAVDKSPMKLGKTTGA